MAGHVYILYGIFVLCIFFFLTSGCKHNLSEKQQDVNYLLVQRNKRSGMRGIIYICLSQQIYYED